MAYDEALAERIRTLLRARRDVVEKRMFGGVAFMIRGHMGCGVLGSRLIVRVNPGDGERLLRIVDNYLEGYHIAIVHPDLAGMLDLDAYRSQSFAGGTVQIAPLRRDDDRALYFWFFPNLMINVYHDNFSTNLIVPLGPDRTLTIFEWFQLNSDGGAARRDMDRIVETSDRIQQEDTAICEAVHKGLASRGYDRGRYAPRHESGLHHFHRLLQAALEEAP